MTNIIKLCFIPFWFLWSGGPRQHSSSALGSGVEVVHVEDVAQAAADKGLQFAG